MTTEPGKRRLSVSRRLSIHSALVDALVEEIREKQLLKMSEDIDSYHLEDVYALRSNDWNVKRFVLEHKCDRDDAAAALDKALQWRKASGIAIARYVKDFKMCIVLIRCMINVVNK